MIDVKEMTPRSLLPEQPKYRSFVAYPTHIPLTSLTCESLQSSHLVVRPNSRQQTLAYLIIRLSRASPGETLARASEEAASALVLCDCARAVLRCLPLAEDIRRKETSCSGIRSRVSRCHRVDRSAARCVDCLRCRARAPYAKRQ